VADTERERKRLARVREHFQKGIQREVALRALLFQKNTKRNIEVKVSLDKIDK
jgi:hypothetical protein